MICTTDYVLKVTVMTLIAPHMKTNSSLSCCKQYFDIEIKTENIVFISLWRGDELFAQSLCAWREFHVNDPELV